MKTKCYHPYRLLFRYIILMCKTSKEFSFQNGLFMIFLKLNNDFFHHQFADRLNSPIAQLFGILDKHIFPILEGLFLCCVIFCRNKNGHKLFNNDATESAASTVALFEWVKVVVSRLLMQDGLEQWFITCIACVSWDTVAKYAKTRYPKLDQFHYYH